mmetsp:Transcript_39057/g.69995  ORF Transcript_39057/g.69995 Transcript_39057/m.69995 type:complete len:202 (+) Transcript_39057:317-922(+)
MGPQAGPQPSLLLLAEGGEASRLLGLRLREASRLLSLRLCEASRLLNLRLCCSLAQRVDVLRRLRHGLLHALRPQLQRLQVGLDCLLPLIPKGLCQLHELRQVQHFVLTRVHLRLHLLQAGAVGLNLEAGPHDALQLGLQVRDVRAPVGAAAPGLGGLRAGNTGTWGRRTTEGMGLPVEEGVRVALACHGAGQAGECMPGP